MIHVLCVGTCKKGRKKDGAHVPVEELLAPRLLVGTRRYPQDGPGPPFAATGH